jgi:hypothetical protein
MRPRSQKKQNFTNAIAEFGPSPTLQETLTDIEAEKKDLALRRCRLEQYRTKKIELPESIGELRQLLEDKFRQLAIDSPEFGDLMRQPASIFPRGCSFFRVVCRRSRCSWPAAKAQPPRPSGFVSRKGGFRNFASICFRLGIAFRVMSLPWRPHDR